MSSTFYSCWKAKTQVKGSRQTAVYWSAITAVILALVLMAEFQPQFKWVSLIAIPLLSYMEWRRQPALIAIHYQPDVKTFYFNDDSVWRHEKGSPGLCYSAFTLLRCENGKRHRWVMVFSDQLSEPHWRRFRVLLSIP